jgi:hypothetical protein
LFSVHSSCLVVTILILYWEIVGSQMLCDSRTWESHWFLYSEIVGSKLLWDQQNMRISRDIFNIFCLGCFIIVRTWRSPLSEHGEYNCTVLSTAQKGCKKTTQYKRRTELPGPLSLRLHSYLVSLNVQLVAWTIGKPRSRRETVSMRSRNEW